MSRYVVRFQLQSGSQEVDSIRYYSNSSPCSQQEALNKLAKLWSGNKDYYRSSRWNRPFKKAIEKAEDAVRRGRNASAGVNRNFYHTRFRYQGNTYRVDVAIEAGSGHFN